MKKPQSSAISTHKVDHLREFALFLVGKGCSGPACRVPEASYPILVRGSQRWAQADQCQMRDGTDPADLPGCLSQAPLHRPGGWLLRVEGDQGSKGQAALCHRYKRRQPVRAWWALGELERPGIGRVGSDFRHYHDRRLPSPGRPISSLTTMLVKIRQAIRLAPRTPPR